MSNLTERQLRDLEPDWVFDCQCKTCGHEWSEPVSEVVRRAPRDTLYLDQVARLLICKEQRCLSVGVKLAVTQHVDTSSFVGGMP